MADNVTVGGVNYSTDDVTTLNGATITAGTAQTQRMKVQYGDDGTARDVSQLFPLPVNLAASGGSGTQTSGALTAAGASTLAGTTSTTGTVVVDVGNAGNISFHLSATAFVGTVVFEQSFDPAGTAGTWAAVPVIPEDATSAPMTTLAINTAVAYVRQFTTGMFGPRLFRVRASVFTSGSLSVLASAGPGWIETQPALAPSTAVIGAVDLGTATAGALTAGTTSATANTNTVAIAADPTRKGLTITNIGTAPIRLGYGVATTTTLYTALVNPGRPWAVEPWAVKLALNVSSSVASVGYNVQSGT